MPCLCCFGKPEVDEREAPAASPDAPVDQFDHLEGEKATFGMNTLWTAEAKMDRIPGVIRSRVGYMGGTEVVEIEFDKQLVHYNQILDVFWKSHDRCAKVDRKNLSAIFYHTMEQKHAAEKSLINEMPKWKEEILTEILPAEEFLNAQDSQQKYFVQRHKEIYDMLNMKSGAQLIRSHVACRINGFLGGYGSLHEFDVECQSMKLPDDVITYIRTKVEELKVAET